MTGVPPALQRKRLLALAALWFERLWPALWPAIGAVCVYLCLALFGLLAILPAWPRLLLLVLAVVLAAGLGARGVRRLRRPDRREADRRLEAASGLRHRPLAALEDTPANASPEAEALWRLHLARVAGQVTRLRRVWPRPGLAAQDGWALRGGLLVALVAALGVAGPDASSRLKRALWPSLPAVAAGPATAVQGWLTPPAYTGLPPVILRTATAEARVPAGSHIVISVTGGSGTPALDLGDAHAAFTPLDAASWQAEGELRPGATVHATVRRGGSVLATWTLTPIPDQPPVAAWSEPPGPVAAERQAAQQVRLPWQAADDYGVAGVQVEMRLRDRPEAPPLVVAGAVGGNPKSPHATIVTDLTAHPWAGLAVRARVVAKDAAGQTGASADAEFALPERAFRHPVAQALAQIRRQLSLTPEDRAGAGAAVDGLAEQPDAYDNSAGIMLNLRALSALLRRGREPTTVAEAQARMWDLAIALEEGEAGRTAQALDQARQALRDALQQDQSQQANRDAVDRRVQELRDAIQRHLEALAEQARREGADTPFDPSLPYMDAHQLDRLAEQAQRELQQGKKEDAERDIAKLEQMLEQLRNAKPESAEARAQRRQQQRQRGEQQQSAVQDMVQREGKLLDRSETRMAPGDTRPDRPSPGGRQSSGQQQSGQPQSGQPQSGQQPGQPQPGQSAQAGPPGERSVDARQQRAMRRALGELMQQFSDLTGEVPGPLGEADQAMRDAATALGDGRESEANDATRRAIDALQRGNQEMGNQLAQQFGEGMQLGEGEGEGDDGRNADGTDNRPGRTTGPQPGEERSGGSRRNARRDPLGRPLDDGANGTSEGTRQKLPEEMEQARTREIQEELRRRGAERSRPQPELDYIDRLLRSF